MIVTTEAIVLRSMKYRDTSRIVTLYTKTHGKLSGIVKGARSAKNPFGAALQPMAHVNVVLYMKEGRDLQSITQAELLESYQSLSEDLRKMATGMAIVELVGNIAHEEEENRALYQLIVDTLAGVDATTRDPAEQFFRFEVKLAGILGFKPVFDLCVSCGKSLPNSAAEVTFDLERGGPLCSKCSAGGGQKTAISAKLLHYLAGLDSEEKKSPSPTVPEGKGRNAIERLLETFLRNHVSGMRVSRSDRVFSKLLER